MKTKIESKPGWAIQFKPLVVTSCVGIILLLPLFARGAGVVNNCTEPDLRAAMAGGGTVTFACDGTITLANTITNALDAVLDGSGHQITISGNNTCRVFFVNSNVSLTTIYLTIANGRSDNGACIYNAGGFLFVRNCVLSGNAANGLHGAFSSNNPGSNSCGGAIFNSGVAVVANSTFSTNTAVGGGGGNGFYGGTTGGYGNGGNGGIGGFAYGGAIYNFGDLTLSNCTLFGNSAAGGTGGSGGNGGNWGGSGGNGGAAGSSYGGAIFNYGVATLINSTLAENTSAGGSGGNGGDGGGYEQWNPGNGGNGNAGGSSSGGAINDLTGQCRLTNCTLTSNSTIAGGGGSGGGGAYGSDNETGSPGLPGVFGSSSGGGISAKGGSFLINILLVSNIPGNGFGAITDGGHNLSSDNSCGFTNTGSLNNSSPLLGPLMDNGGPNLTMALLPDSPAIDAGDTTAAPLADQRGVARPAGLASDIGAYECGPPDIITAPSSQGVLKGATVDLSATVAGYPPLSFQWIFNNTNIISGATNSVLHLVDVQPFQSGTYALLVTNAYGAVMSPPAVFDVIYRTVTKCTETILRLAMATGGTVTFACDGTITLSNAIEISTNIVLDGSGHQVSISGGNAVRVFFVETNLTLTLANLTIANGFSDSGAGIYNSGGALTLINCFFLSNCAQGAMGANGMIGQNGYGGALYNLGVATANDCMFVSNSAIGGTGGEGITGMFSPGGQGAVGGDGDGSAICNFGNLIVAGCSLVSNSSCGGKGGAGGWGGYITFGPGNPGGKGGIGGNGNGGALLNFGEAFLQNNTIAFNSGAGGEGGDGGWGGEGASPDWPPGSTGTGGTGGAGFGALYDVNSHCYVTNCTLALNYATNGTGGNGSSSGANGVAGGGGLWAVSTTLVNTLISANTPRNCSGTIIDAGHNLSSDGSCSFTGAGSLNNTDPLLGPLADNGGPTLTMALLPGSPAINAGSSADAPLTDQRGVIRPQGPGVDIGAFEFLYNPVFLEARFLDKTNFWLEMIGRPNQIYTLQISSDLLIWYDLTNCTACNKGTFDFVDSNPEGCQARFYRLRLSSP